MFKDLTVESITREAGGYRSAFYLCFRGKEELLLGALEDLIASHQNGLGNSIKVTFEIKEGKKKKKGRK